MKYLPAVLLVALSVADITLTRLMLSTYGGEEINPLLAPVIGTWWLFGIKTVGVAIVAALCVRFIKTAWIERVLFGVVGIYIVVVTFNLSQILIVEAL